MLCATSVILKIIELANCTRSWAVIDEGFGFLSPPCSCLQNVAPVSYRQQIQESQGERSTIQAAALPEQGAAGAPTSKIWPFSGLWCCVFGSNILGSYSCAPHSDKTIFLIDGYATLSLRSTFSHFRGNYKERGSALIYCKISFISLQSFPPSLKRHCY